MTNGLGGYACGTIAAANTRRYHGFLMASLRPPVERTLLVAKVDVTVSHAGRRYPLFANEYQGNVLDPRGFVHLESFSVEHGIPVWRYALADALVEQRVFMQPGANTSYLRIDVLRAATPLSIEFKPLVTYRDFHSQGRGARPFRATATGAACTVTAFDGAQPYTLALAGGRHTPADLWYWNFLHREEFGRGLDALEDLWGPGTFTADLAAGESICFTASSESGKPAAPDKVLEALCATSQRLIAALPKTAPSWVRTLATASDQFIVQRGAKGASSASIIAGYPWFSDWGRDTMISLSGLTTVLGRHDTAAAILKTYASFVDRGMLPNRFADVGESLEYNTADAALWMFQAVAEHLEAHNDPKLLRELFPALLAIIHAHAEGTRYGIHVDAADGLLHAGEAGIQLTWMDAKQGDHVFTPRTGKPVEINALWINALDVAVRLAGRLRKTAEKRFCQSLLERAEQGFARYWNAELGCLYDVLDEEAGAAAGSDSRCHGRTDPSIRPNQILAVSLPRSVLTADQMRGVVDTCARELLTSYGLRSLSPGDTAYLGGYHGNAWQRDAAYHQGSVWSWLLGPFARAHYRVYGDASRAQAFLQPIAQHLMADCVGSVSEIFDGDAPHLARGCFAQAWGVAEILRSWIFLERNAAKASGSHP